MLSYTWLWLYRKNSLYVCSLRSGLSNKNSHRKLGGGVHIPQIKTGSKSYIICPNRTANKKQTRVLSTLTLFFKMSP